MTDTFSKLKEELSVLYPDFTDVELNEATSNLIDFYKTIVKVALKKQENNQNINVDDQDFSNQPN